MGTLREELQEITKQDIGKHPALLKELTVSHENSIELLNSPHSIDRYTCLVHAFGFVEEPEYLEVACFGQGRYFASPDFANWLVDRGALAEVSREQAIPGDMVFYFHDGKCKHAGTHVAPGRIQSKWGTGHLYEHPVFEVPESYGTVVRYFRKMPFDNAIALLREYAECRMRDG